MQFTESQKAAKLAKAEAKRVAEMEAKMLESQQSETPPSTPTKQPDVVLCIKPLGEDDGEEKEDDEEEDDRTTEDDEEDVREQLAMPPVPQLQMRTRGQRLLSSVGEAVTMECSPLFEPAPPLLLEPGPSAAPLLLEAGPSAAPRLRDMPPLGMGVKSRVAAIEAKEAGAIPMDEDNE